MQKYIEIKSVFETLRNDKKSAEMAAYMRNKFDFYGIATPNRRAAYKHLLASEKRSKVIDHSLLDQCWNDNYRECQYFVLDYLHAMQPILTFDDITWIETYVRTKQWWDTIDALDTIIGSIGLKDNRVAALMLKWSKDDDFWVRRTAIDHQLCYKDKTDTRLLEQIIENNLGSNEFFINKAIGWSLRQYSKTNPEWVNDFIDSHRHLMSALSIREGSKYL